MINIVKKYLDKSNYSYQKDDFEEAFLSHPNYPSLFAITDSLDMLTIENIALKIPKEQFVGLPDTFITFFKEEFVLVSKKSDSVIIETENEKKKKIFSEEFLKNWNQIILAIEPNSKESNLQIKNSYSKWLLYSLPATLLVLSSVFLFEFSGFNFLILGTTLLGLMFSILILQEKFGIKTEMGSKLCSININVSCESVIKSHKSEIFRGLSFYDLPILFFGINFLSIVFEPTSSTLIISGLSLLSIPLLFYSIWLQKRILKKWCVLCLSVSLIIFLQGISYFFQSDFFESISFSGYLIYFQSVILFISSWFLIRPTVESNIKLKGGLDSLKRIKRSFKVFKSFMREIEVKDGLETFKGIQYGDSTAPIKLTLFLSPSCGHCHQAFRDARNLFEKYPDKVYLNMLFNINPENENNRYLPIVQTLLAINSTDREKAKEALNDWHDQNLSLQTWKDKWQVLTHNMIANNQIHKQYEWCVANKLNFTPVKIVNNELFPNEYGIDELKFFVNDYEEENGLSQNNENLKVI